MKVLIISQDSPISTITAIAIMIEIVLTNVTKPQSSHDLITKTVFVYCVCR